MTMIYFKRWSKITSVNTLKITNFSTSQRSTTKSNWRSKHIEYRDDGLTSSLWLGLALYLSKHHVRLQQRLLSCTALARASFFRCSFFSLSLSVSSKTEVTSISIEIISVIMIEAELGLPTIRFFHCVAARRGESWLQQPFVTNGLISDDYLIWILDIRVYNVKDRLVISRIEWEAWAMWAVVHPQRNVTSPTNSMTSPLKV